MKIISNSRHRTTLRYNITEMVKQLKQFLLRKRIRISTLYPGDFARKAMMHITRRLLVDISERIFQSILINPDLCRELITGKIIQGSFVGFIECISLLLHDIILFSFLHIQN